MDYVKFLYRPLAARAARQVLVGRNRAPQSPDRAQDATTVAGRQQFQAMLVPFEADREELDFSRRTV